MWTPDLNRQLVTKKREKKSHSESGRHRGAVTQSKTIWHKHQQSQCVGVSVCVFDIDPAEQQDTYSAVSGKKLVSVFAVTPQS